MKYPTLFSPIRLRDLALKNRIMLPAMGSKFTRDNYVTDQLINYHVARARGGTGLSMLEVCGVHAPSIPNHYFSIAEDRFIPGLRRLTGAVHDAGGKMGVQLWQGSIAVASDPKAQIIVASDMPLSPGYTVPGASHELIAELVDAYGSAARRAVEAGFDCVEVHVAHNYILHSFLSGGINHRQDEYGGSLENRARFPLAVLERVRATIPGGMPLLMRIDAHDDYLEGGLTIEEVIQFCKWAGEKGVDALDISRGNIISAGLKYEVPPMDFKPGFNIENAARIRRETGLVTIGVGRINGPVFAEEILKAGKVDMVAIGRAQIADPEFCNKARTGGDADIVRCIGCNQGCYDANERSDMPHITCLRNPAVGLEAEYALQPTDAPKTIAIAGAGMAGLELAYTLKQRSHNPVVFESSGAVGGQFVLAGLAPRKAEMKAAAQHRGLQVTRMGVPVHLSTPLTPELLRELRPGVVVNATGAVPLQLDVPGADSPHVYSYPAVLLGEAAPEGHIAVIGGGLVGLEVAETLLHKGRRVSIVEMLPALGEGLGTTRKIVVMENLHAAGATMLTGAKCVAIEPGGVVVEQDGKQQTISCDAVVVAIGARSRDASPLAKTCTQLGIAYHSIGDAIKPRRALNATAEAAKLAREL